MIRILCYGDSNTWGNIPGIGTRYPAHIRWPGILAQELGDAYTIVEDGLNGRTTVYDDNYVDFRNGKKGLGYSLSAHAPIDLVILSLGTNDLKFTGAAGSAKGAEALLHYMKAAEVLCRYPTSGGSIFPNGQKVLLVSPISLSEHIAESFPDSPFAPQYQESRNMSRYFRMVAEEQGAYFLDAAQFAQPSETDGVHMDPQSHSRLGRAIAEKVREIFA